MIFSQKWSDRIVMNGLLIGNFFYSIAKKSLASSIPLLKRSLNVSKQDLGGMSSDFSLAYGVSKLVGGAMSDVLPPYILFTVGLFLGAFVNLSITGVTDIESIGYLWMLNGLGQGVGGPALSKVVVELFPSNVRASVWSSLTFACNLGYLTAPSLLGHFSTGTWQSPFLVAGLGSLVSAPIMGVNYMIFLRPPASDKVELAGRDEKSKFAPTITLSVEEVEGLSSAATEQAPILSHKEDKPTAVVSDITTHSTCSSNGSGDASVSPAVAAAIGAEVSTAISVQTTNKENNINVESAETEETEAQKNKDTAMKTILASAPSTIHVSAIDTVFRGKSSTTAAAGVLSSLSLSLLGLVSKSLLLFAATFLSYFISKGVSDWTALYLMEYMQYKEGPRMQVVEIVLWSEVGGIVGSVVVGKLSDFLHNRKSLACCLFTLCCILGLWSLALHTPLLHSAGAEDGASYYPFAAIAGSAHTSDADLSGALVGLQQAVVLAPGRDTCVDPSAFQRNSDICKYKHIDAANIVHPLELFQSLLKSTILLMFPQPDSSTLLVNQYASRVGTIISKYIKLYISTNPYITMRAVLFIVGFGINGPKTLVALELMELLPKHLCGTLTGVAGLVAQMGAACAGKYVAHTIMQEGWCTFVALLTVASALLSVILALSAMI